MKWTDYREKLGIGFNDEEKAAALANKISTFVEFGAANQDYSHDSYYDFCLMVGYKFRDMLPANQYFASLIQKSNHSIPDMLSYYIAFVNTQRTTEKPKRYLIDVLSDFLDELNIQYEIFEDNDGYFVFPKGVVEFDNELVSQPLEWLRNYPNTEIAWSKALREYAEATDDEASDVADKFRKALEAFFQEFFGGSKSLENYKAEYGGYLKQGNIPKEISGNFETVLQAYTNYINNYAKHRDGTSDKVLEYIMYQTGNIIRLLITLKQEETANAD